MADPIIVPPLVLACLAVMYACGRHKERAPPRTVCAKTRHGGCSRARPARRGSIVLEGCTVSGRQRIHSCSGAKRKLVWPRGLVEHSPRRPAIVRRADVSPVAMPRTTPQGLRIAVMRVKAIPSATSSAHAPDSRAHYPLGFAKAASDRGGSQVRGRRRLELQHLCRDGLAWLRWPFGWVGQAARVASSPGASSAAVSTWRRARLCVYVRQALFAVVRRPLLAGRRAQLQGAQATALVRSAGVASVSHQKDAASVTALCWSQLNQAQL